MFKLENLIFFPQDIKDIDKTGKIKIIVWVIISFIFFHLSILPIGFRTAWGIYVIGILPVMIAFSNKEYVISKLEKEYPSLKYVLYKNSLVWMAFYIIAQICAYESLEEVFIRVCAISVFWVMSIVLITIYDLKMWILMAVFTISISVIFLIWMRTDFGQKDIDYIVPIIFVILVICISILIINIQIKKFNNT